jgi:DNA mismatch repair protein MutL
MADTAVAVRIHKLSEDTVRGIAAGEVVDRPSSALKELIENALDAGAEHIAVEWTDAGRTLLRVTDDGCGMIPADARLALERHATSKIARLADLERVTTFGFRGEALPAMAAVSRFTLVTRPASAGEAWSIQSEGGHGLTESPAGAPAGTSVTLKDLFFALPARKKFLKSDAVERGHLLRVVEDAALGALGVSFRVTADGKEVMNLPAALPDQPFPAALKERLRLLWGASRLDASVAVGEKGPFMSLKGWISDIHASQSTARTQRFFINGRAVIHRRLQRAVYDAYRGRLLMGRHPLAALFVDVDPARVDVNVHPAKREVRLSHEEEMHGFVLKSLEKALTGASLMPDVFGASPTGSLASLPEWRARRPPDGVRDAAALYDPRSTTEIPAAEPVFSVPDARPLGLDEFRRAPFEPLAQLDGTYIVARAENRLYVFDQHAAAERVLYEQLTDAAQTEGRRRQALLLPWVWDASPALAAVVSEHLADFENLGYLLEPFGTRAFRVTAVPGVLGDSPMVRFLLEGLAEDLATGTVQRGWDALVTRAACRGSVKANDPLAIPEMDRIIKDLKACRSPWSCPHGRPTFLRLSGDELAKRFKRG